jgi:hypothetical protein
MTSLSKCRRVFELILAGTATVAMAQSPAQKPAVWIAPPGIDNGKALRAMFEHPEGWSRTRELVDVLLYTDHNMNRFSDDDLRRWFGMMREWNLRLGLEVGAVKEWGLTGDDTFRKETPMWDRLQKLGGKISAIAMDEPLLCARKKIHKSDEYAVEETAKFIALVRERYPEMRIGDIEPYPSIPLADHFRWMENLNRVLRERNVHGLDFYRLDVNWINFTVQQTGSWKEVKQLEQYCRAHAIAFSLIYWPSDLPVMKRLGMAGDSTWYISIMRQAQDYAAVGGSPDEYVIESWVGEPPQAVPDTADWTFTRSVRDFVERYVLPRKQLSGGANVPPKP